MAYYFSRERALEELGSREFDIVIIGGGIIGAGIARDAAMRGLSVALLEARDFAVGTSSRSSKLLHGGIRYLEQFHLGLVFEASQERRLHSEYLVPHLARAVPFMIPIYPWSPHGRLAISLGVFLYDALALFRNHGSRYPSASTSMREEPHLESAGLKGSVVYHDVVMDDARMNLEVMRSAAWHGAVVANYLPMRGFDKDSFGRIKGIWARDAIGEGTDFLIKARLVVNATGPWSDYIRRLDNPSAKAMLRPTKGVHLVLPDSVLGKKHAFVLTAKKDNRVFFSIPWFDRTLVGTTDTDYSVERDGDLYDVHAHANEVDYLMEGVRRTFPGATVGPGDILSTFAGVRPLVADPKSNNPSAVSREHLIWQEVSGLLNIAGGKYTTYRTMAQQLVDQAVKYLKSAGGIKGLKPCATQKEPLVQLDSAKDRARTGFQLDDYSRELSAETVAHLQRRYSARWQEVADLALDNKDLRERVIPDSEEIHAEMEYAKRFEMAQNFEDYLRRRSQLALRSNLRKYDAALSQAYKVFRGNQSVALQSQEIDRIQGGV